MCYYVGFGLVSVAMMVLLYPLFYNSTDWNPYAVWIMALSITTFLMYGLDKLLSKIGNVRTPELILHLLAILGGFPGGWLGRAVWRHKTNVTKHPWFPIVLVISTAGHTLLTYYWFFRDP
jgi:uncharacterized membrane protein YsdA (DUF1294 family)